MTQSNIPSQARQLLDALVERRLLELEEGSDRTLLLSGIELQISASADPRERAARLAQWLLEQREVAELYASDDQLEDILLAPR